MEIKKENLYVVDPIDIDKILYWTNCKALDMDKLPNNFKDGEQIYKHEFNVIFLTVDVNGELIEKET